MTPLSSLDGTNWTPHQLAEDSCGLIAEGPRETLHKQVVRHFHAEHPDVRVLVEGVHFTVREAPMRCDVCGGVAERPWWNHVSTPPTDTDFVKDHDGEWLLCDPCHEFFAVGNMKGWVRWCVQQTMQATQGTTRMPEAETSLRVTTFQVLHRLMRNLDNGTRETL